MSYQKYFLFALVFFTFSFNLYGRSLKASSCSQKHSQKFFAENPADICEFPYFNGAESKGPTGYYESKLGCKFSSDPDSRPTMWDHCPVELGQQYKQFISFLIEHEHQKRRIYVGKRSVTAEDATFDAFYIETGLAKPLKDLQGIQDIAIFEEPIPYIRPGWNSDREDDFVTLCILPTSSQQINCTKYNEESRTYQAYTLRSSEIFSPDAKFFANKLSDQFLCVESKEAKSCWSLQPEAVEVDLVAAVSPAKLNKVDTNILQSELRRVNDHIVVSLTTLEQDYSFRRSFTRELTPELFANPNRSILTPMTVSLESAEAAAFAKRLKIPSQDSPLEKQVYFECGLTEKTGSPGWFCWDTDSLTVPPPDTTEEQGYPIGYIKEHRTNSVCWLLSSGKSLCKSPQTGEIKENTIGRYDLPSNHFFPPIDTITAFKNNCYETNHRGLKREVCWQAILSLKGEVIRHSISVRLLNTENIRLIQGTMEDGCGFREEYFSCWGDGVILFAPSIANVEFDNFFPTLDPKNTYAIEREKGHGCARSASGERCWGQYAEKFLHYSAEPDSHIINLPDGTLCFLGGGILDCEPSEHYPWLNQLGSIQSFSENSGYCFHMQKGKIKRKACIDKSPPDPDRNKVIYPIISLDGMMEMDFQSKFRVGNFATCGFYGIEFTCWNFRSEVSANSSKSQFDIAMTHPQNPPTLPASEFSSGGIREIEMNSDEFCLVGLNYFSCWGGIFSPAARSFQQKFSLSITDVFIIGTSPDSKRSYPLLCATGIPLEESQLRITTRCLNDPAVNWALPGTEGIFEIENFLTANEEFVCTFNSTKTANDELFYEPRNCLERSYRGGYKLSAREFFPLLWKDIEILYQHDLLLVQMIFASMREQLQDSSARKFLYVFYMAFREHFLGEGIDGSKDYWTYQILSLNSNRDDLKFHVSRNDISFQWKEFSSLEALYLQIFINSLRTSLPLLNVEQREEIASLLADLSLWLVENKVADRYSTKARIPNSYLERMQAATDLFRITPYLKFRASYQQKLLAIYAKYIEDSTD